MLFSPTVWLIVLNIAAYLFLGTQGVNLLSPPPAALIALGGNLGPLTLTGDYWRLLTSMFLHGGPLHLALNMYLLFQIGFVSEAVWGRFRFLVIYLLTGLFGSLASAIWTSSGNATVLVSIGASGALLGIAAALLPHAIKEKQAALVDMKAVAQVVFLNIGMGFMLPGVDNACHIGGALAGFTIGGLLQLPAEKFKMNETGKSAFVFFASLLVLVGILRMPPSEQVVDLGMDLRIGFSELQNLEALRMKKQKMAAEAELESKSIPAPVSMDEAAGKSLVFENGASDFILPPGDRFMYFPNRGTNSLAVVDLKTLSFSKEIKGPRFPADNSGCPDDLCRGRGASGVAVSKDSSWAIVTSMVQDSVSKIDLKTDKLLWSVKVGRFPRTVFLSQNQKYAFAVNAPENTVSIVDLDQQKLLQTLPLGTAISGPFGRYIGAAQSAQRVYFADGSGTSILSVDSESPKELKNEVTPEIFSATTLAMSHDGKHLWAAGTAGMMIYDAKTFKVVDTFPACANNEVNEFALSPDGAWLAVEQHLTNTLRIVSTKTLRTVRVLPSSSGNNVLRFSDDGKFLYMLSIQPPAAALTKFDLSKTLDVPSAIGENGEVFCLPGEGQEPQ